MSEPLKFISGLANCHLRGLDSLVIRDRISPQDGMIRVFRTSPSLKMTLMANGDDFLLKPHNHRQDITLTLLAGRVTNVKFTFDCYGAHDVHVYKFGSALLRGKFDVRNMGNIRVRMVEEPLVPNVPMFLRWIDVHTILAEPNSVWMVREFDLAPANNEICLSCDPHLILYSTGLYRPMDEAEVSATQREINKLIP